MAPVAGASDDPVLIKKYANRRLYDTRRSKYITLDDLARMIRAGNTVKVVDANRGDDLTRQVLTQVLLEEQDRLDMIPVEMLHHIIKVQGTMLQGPFASFLSMAMKQFHASGSVWQRQMNAMFEGWPAGGGTPAEPAAPQAPEDDDDTAATTSAAGDGEDLGDLRTRMDALLDRLGKGRR
jgi:polyhydroxyalkanoate synthesis repressor PhaR